MDPMTNNETLLRTVSPNITYHLDNNFLSAEFIARMPLPHRIGTKLYTDRDPVVLKDRANLPLTTNEMTILANVRKEEAAGTTSLD